LTRADHELFRNLIQDRRDSFLEWISMVSEDQEDENVSTSVLQALERALDRFRDTDLGTCNECKAALERELVAVRPDSGICLDCMADGDRRQLEEDLTQAQEVNRSLLPQIVNRIGSFEIGIQYEPSRFLSGDFYDIRPQSNQDVVKLAVGDVAGKGLPAGLLRASLQATMRAFEHQPYSPATLLQLANRSFMALTSPARFASVFYGVLSDEDGSLVYANGGHLPPLLRRAEGGWQRLEPTGTVLGILADSRYEQRTVALQPGDLLVLYTDGVTEAERASGDFFDEHNLVRIIDDSALRPAQEIADLVVAELDSFSPPPPNDDRTLMVLRRR
jgi:sigma-B regulation protein RsbU (phosphoserine phosphatase)